jgi:hypothetical protein
MLRKLDEIRVRTGVSENLCISYRNHAPPLPLERPANDRGPAASATSVDDLVYEFNELVRKAYSYLLAHTNTVPDWYQATGRRPTHLLMRRRLR